MQEFMIKRFYRSSFWSRHIYFLVPKSRERSFESTRETFDYLSRQLKIIVFELMLETAFWKEYYIANFHSADFIYWL